MQLMYKMTDNHFESFSIIPFISDVFPMKIITFKFQMYEADERKRERIGIRAITERVVGKKQIGPIGLLMNGIKAGSIRNEGFSCLIFKRFPRIR